MKNGKKRNYNRFSVINAAAVLFALFSVGLLSLILPKPTVSEMEKRTCQKAAVEPFLLVFGRVCKTV